MATGNSRARMECRVRTRCWPSVYHGGAGRAGRCARTTRKKQNRGHLRRAPFRLVVLVLQIANVLRECIDLCSLDLVRAEQPKPLRQIAFDALRLPNLVFAVDHKHRRSIQVCGEQTICARLRHARRHGISRFRKVERPSVIRVLLAGERQQHARRLRRSACVKVTDVVFV